MTTSTRTFDHKAFPAEMKALDAKQGIVEALVSVFGNVDHGGDRVVKGAFTETLAEHAAAGKLIPFVWSHNIYNLDAYVGKVLEAEERDAGLWVKAQLFIDEASGAKAFRLLDEKVVTEFSFTYITLDSKTVTEDGEEIRELLKLDLWEVGPTLRGMNPDTALLAAASRAGVPGVVPAAPAAPVDEQKKAPDDDESLGDKQGSIDPERREAAVALLAKTRHTEE